MLSTGAIEPQVPYRYIRPLRKDKDPGSGSGRRQVLPPTQAARDTGVEPGALPGLPGIAQGCAWALSGSDGWVQPCCWARAARMCFRPAAPKLSAHVTHRSGKETPPQEQEEAQG